MAFDNHVFMLILPFIVHERKSVTFSKVTELYSNVRNISIPKQDLGIAKQAEQLSKVIATGIHDNVCLQQTRRRYID